MPATFLKIHPTNPEQRKLKQAIQIIEDGGLVIYPTDTLYGLGCLIHNNKSVERICRIKSIKPNKATFSFICADLSDLSLYAKPFSNRVYKLMRQCLPGPYTFILNASNQIPKLLKNKRKSVGIRVPNSPIVAALVSHLDSPLMSTSITNIDEEISLYPTDPEAIYEQYKHQVDLVIDGGPGGNIPSTVIDCTNDEIELIRQGLGKLDD